MKKLLFISILILTFSFAVCAQDEKKVEILQSTADKCSRCFDESEALKNEIVVKDKAIEDLKKEITRLQIELGKTVGELVGEKSISVQQRAIIEVLLKSVRPKKIGLINF